MESSSFPGLIYSGKRGKPFPNIYDWMKVRTTDDNIGNYWRVHDKLYDLKEFIPKHPGGAEWIRTTEGMDITEAFEASHIIGFQNVEKILAKYYIKDATQPRNSPYTFKPSGFYKTLKKRMEPVLKEVGTGPSSEAVMIQDGLAIAFIALALIAVRIGSVPLQMMAGIVLGMNCVCAHNFFHQKDNFRMFYFDLGPLSSFEWRFSHAFSHHLYPNTILDFEVLLAEPLLAFLPSKQKTFVQKYVAMFYMDLLPFIFGLSQILTRFINICKGKQQLRPENLVIFVELFVYICIAPSVQSAFTAWILIFMTATFWFIFVGQAHHHPISFHDGDEARPDPDFGLCQLDATRGKSDSMHKTLFLILTTFGEHPTHHLFPTVCHSKLKFLKPILAQTLEEFSEEFPLFTQLELYIGCRKQLSRTTPNPFKPQMKKP